jgi:hypothetical protein
MGGSRCRAKPLWSQLSPDVIRDTDAFVQNPCPHHIGVGRTYTGTRVLVLIHDLNVRIIHAATGELLRQLILDPTKDYQPTRAPKGPKRKKFRT